MEMNGTALRQYTMTNDAMAPTFPRGSIALAREINPDRFIEWGEAYLLETIDGPLLARLIPSDNPANYRCTRDNKERLHNVERFADMDIPKDAVTGIFRVFAMAKLM